ncbi:MAG TPA: hypothetical protein VL500_03885 [Candidatus Eisenbacteria bacterium]|jgi:hypothetical protein|nr:hypothetical protein [Candidatus Eisenbacteria bacterium]
MILFFVGIIEMAIATYWTRFVTNANVRMTGVVTGINFTIWYFVIRQIVENIDNWQAIVPYGAGCVAGSMIGVAFDIDVVMARTLKWFRKTKKPTAVRTQKAVTPSVPGPIAIDYEHP